MVISFDRLHDCGHTLLSDTRPEIKIPSDAGGILIGGGLVFDFAGFVFIAPIFAFLLTKFGPKCARRNANIGAINTNPAKSNTKPPPMRMPPASDGILISGLVSERRVCPQS